MSIDNEVLQEYKEELVDRYEAIELCELFIEALNLSAWDIIELMGDERVMELKWR